MQIRPFQPSDLPRLKEITVEAFNGVSIDQAMHRAFGPINGRDWRWRKARHLDEDVEREVTGIFVAVDAVEGEEEEQIVGYITTWSDRQAGVGHIPNLALTAQSRGKGFGRMLIEFALAHFRAQGLSHARIETLVQNDVGNHLYQSIGFREMARQIHFAIDLTSSRGTIGKDESP